MGWFRKGRSLEKPTIKQSVLLGLGFVALMVSGYLVFRSDPSQPPDLADVPYSMVCVKTGRRFEMKRKDIRMLPAKNPETSEFTLLPCEERDGKWFIVSRYEASLGGMSDVNRFVDPQTYEVKETP